MKTHGVDPIRTVIVATHPIQYQVPWYRALERRSEVDLTVFYAQIPDRRRQGVGFDVSFEWDVPLLDGYTWEVLDDRARQPDLYRFSGTHTPDVIGRIRAVNADAVVITGWHSRAMLQALWACMRLGIPRLVRGEANALRQRPFWARTLHRLLLARFDAYLPIGKASEAFYRGYGISSDRLFPAPYFIENDRFAAQMEQARGRRSELRKRWGIPEGRTCFLFVGKLEPKKHIFDLLEAVSLMEAGAAHVLIVGSGEQMEGARALAARRGLPVTFAGFLNQTEITDAYAAADCLVLPSDYGETWGLVVNEAMACGLAAVVSDRVGCRRDLIVEEKTGVSFPFADVDALADRLSTLASAPDRLRTMGERAREHVLAYSADAAADGTVAALEAVLRRRTA